MRTPKWKLSPAARKRRAAFYSRSNVQLHQLAQMMQEGKGGNDDSIMGKRIDLTQRFSYTP